MGLPLIALGMSATETYSGGVWPDPNSHTHRNPDVHNSVAALAGKPPIRIISRIVSWEMDNGARHGKVVQSDQGLWIHSAAGGGRDVFVHVSAVERAGLSTLNEGQQIEYEIEENRGKTSAVNLKVK